MKILHLDTEMTWRGGEQQAFWLVEGLLKREIGKQVIVANPESEMAKRAKERDWNVFEVEMRGGWNPKVANKIAKIARQNVIDLAHAHTSHGHTLAWMGLARRKITPVVVTRRVDFPVGKGLFAPFRRAKYTHPWVHLIAISDGVKDVMIEGGLTPDEIAVVSSGIDPRRLQGRRDRDKIRKEIGLGPQTALIGNVAALTDHKGQIYLIQAAKRLRAWTQSLPDTISNEAFRDFKIILIGEGEDRPKLEAEIQNLGLENHVLLLGWRDDIADCMAGMDVFCLPSHLEGLGTAMLDALWMRLPVVASRTGGIPDVLIDGEVGLLSAPKNPKELADALIRMLESPDLRKRFSEEGRRTVERGFTVNRMVEGTLAVYRKALKKK